MKIFLESDKKAKEFAEIVACELKSLRPDIEVVTTRCTGCAVWYLLNGKNNLLDRAELKFNNLGMRFGVVDQEYYLQVDAEIYNRLQYEEFIKLAETNAVKLGVSKYWLLVQLTFPFNFWSLSKQQRIAKTIYSQQYRLLTALCLKG